MFAYHFGHRDPNLFGIKYAMDIQDANSVIPQMTNADQVRTSIL